MTEDQRFKEEVPPLNFGDIFAEVDPNPKWVNILLDEESFTVDEARALRDWLNTVLP